MSWDAVAALAELIGALAVVITVAYLAVQIRQNTQTAHAGVQQGMLDTLHSVRLALSHDPELARLLIKANREYESLTPEEALRFGSFANDFLAIWASFLLQHRRSFVDAELWQSWAAGFRKAFQAPAFRRVWESEKDTFHADFRRHVEGVE
jgi:hypothetical protein